jgi:hypothetical protein
MRKVEPVYLVCVSDADYSVGKLRPKVVLEMRGRTRGEQFGAALGRCALLGESEPSTGWVPP